MPHLTVGQFLQQETGITPSGSLDESARNLTQAANNSAIDLGDILYKAVVRLDGEDFLTGPSLSEQFLKRIESATHLAITQIPGANQTKKKLQDFESAVKRYQTLFSGNVVFLKKGHKSIDPNNLNIAPQHHSLLQIKGEIYELLTWMTEPEVTRLFSHHLDTSGVPSFSVLKERQQNFIKGGIKEYKVTLGSGAFGTVGIARLVNSDQYVVVKKSHSTRENRAPSAPPIQTGINDGTQPGIAKVLGSTEYTSTRTDRSMYTGRSAMTITEMGVIDGHSFIEAFHLQAYALNTNNASTWMAKTIQIGLTGKPSDPDFRGKLFRLSLNPCSQPENVRQFRNTAAFQMLEAVNQMHKKGLAHNDIKPNNFVLAKDDKGLFRFKLIDFDMNQPIKSTIGVPRDVYAVIFSAPQVSSQHANNRADLNDAYSMGCTLKILNGSTASELFVQRGFAKDEIRGDLKRKIKPVEDRRSIEARFKHLPELATVSDLADLLCHPNSGKRYTVQEALESPVFTQSGNLMSASEFSAMAAKIMRHAEMMSPEYKNGWKEMNEQEFTAVVDNPAFLFKDIPVHEMSDCLKNQDRHSLDAHYKLRYGEKKLTQQIEKAKKDEDAGNRAAVLRRGLRQLNIAHHVRSNDQREAVYKYKSLK